MMDKTFQSDAMALAEGAIEVKYNGQFVHACVIIDQNGGTDSSPLIQLGVSDATLADAVSNAETAYTSTSGSDLINEIVGAIHWWESTTSGRRVYSGDWSCNLKHALGNSTIDTPYHASVVKFADDTGSTINFADGDWHDTLLWDNDASSVGHVSLRIAPPQISKGPVTIAAKVGEATVTAGTVLSSGLTFRIYNDNGDVLYTSGAQTVLGNVDLDWQVRPRTYGTPVIFRDTATTPGDGDVDATTATVTWAPGTK